MEAIVLAGGLGTRLRGVVADVPKPMAPVGGRPFLSFVLDRLVDAGVQTAILAVGYRHEAIRSYFSESYRGLALRYSVEREPLGTGGAIRSARGKAIGRDILVLNGDTYVEVALQEMLRAHKQRSAQLTMATCCVPDVARYGALVVSHGIVERFFEKGRSGVGWINAGVYIIGAALCDRLPQRHAFAFEQDFLIPNVQNIRPLAFPVTGRFVDIGVPEDYARAATLLSSTE